MIPVLAIPVLNRPDLLEACLRSIDEPVERLVVIDNSGSGEMGDRASETRPDALIVDPPANLGVAASWNLAIKSTADAPWWCIVNADMAFAPGSLARLAGAMTDAPEVRCLYEFGAFGITAAAVETVGLFDENFHPIYCEDTDYRYRCGLAGVPVIDMPDDSTHVGSVSYVGNPRADNGRTYPSNRRYYAEKWGGDIGRETFTSPFGAGGSVADWTLRLSRVRDNRW